MNSIITKNGHNAFIVPSAGMGQGHDGLIARCTTHRFFLESHQRTHVAEQELLRALGEHVGENLSSID